MTWVAAQAAAVPSLGSSEAVALEASVVEIEITSVRVSGKVMEAERVLVRIEQVVARIERTVGTQAQSLSKLSRFKSAVGSGIKDTVKDSAKSALTDGDVRWCRTDRPDRAQRRGPGLPVRHQPRAGSDH